jgi:8-hydroxy-5-deazaflavin:NADPH oxidoreductase
MADQRTVVAVIGGTGAEGSAIALRLAHAGYGVIIGTRDAAKGARTTAELNAALNGSAVTFADYSHAAESAEIVILAVPFSAEREIVQTIRDALIGKILIDTTAPLTPPKVSNVQLPPGGSAVAEIQSMLGEQVRVVSAFQNVAADKLRRLETDIGCDVLVCADDVTARKTTLELLARMGLRGLDAGPICNSAAAEALTSVLIFLNRKYKVQGAGIRITGLEQSVAASG